MSTSPAWPKFCRHCGTQLPQTQPRFCIECGGDVTPREVAPAAAPSPPAPLPSRERGVRPRPTQKPRPAPTVRLGNAGVEQSVIGGTVQLPTSGAIPPGLWVLDEPPGAEAVLAIYAPLRAVVGGWSGLIGKGWQADGKQDQPDRRAIFRFSAAIEWFPAPGCGGGMRLRARIGAESQAKERGRERRGFRYLAHHDSPMTLLEAAWFGPDGQPRDLPTPQIQIMAPPRVPRFSDFDEQVADLPDAEAEPWSRQGQAPGLWQLYGAAPPSQEHTPAGRGVALIPVGRIESGLRGLLPQGLVNFGSADRFRARVERPYTCELAVWNRQLKKIRAEARDLGMAMEAEPAAEWWLDRNGYDSLILTRAQARYRAERALIAFRRSQIVRVVS